MKRRVMPIYKIPVFFTNDEAELSAFFKAHGAEREDDGKAHLRGGFYTTITDSEDATWRIMAVFEPDVEYVVHESVHAAIEIAEHLGMNIDFKNSEPVCYIAQWFFETMLSLYPSPIKREDAA